MVSANMIAIILENNKEYVSPVFAIRQAGWQSEALAFNKERTHLRRIKIWHPRRQVFIVDWERLSDAGGVMAKHCILLKLYKW